MTSLLSHLSEIVSAAFAENGYGAHFGEVMLSERPDLGQYQTTGALKAAKEAGQSPRDIAEKVAASLQGNTDLHTVLVEGPGFINFSVSDNFLTEFLNRANQEELVPKTSSPKTVVIDFGGPNVAKPLHVGHLRSSIIGDSLQRLYRKLGHTVYGDIHLGDWGTPMGMLIAIIQKKQITEPVTNDDLEQLYPEASALFKTDPEFQKAAQLATAELQQGNPEYRALWEHFIEVSEGALHHNFDRLKVTFDWWYGESHCHDRIAPLLERLKGQGLAAESEGALIIPLENNTAAPLPPLILVKADGGFLYSTTDLACVEERVNENHADLILYVVDQRQHLHFTQVFAASRLAGLAPESVELTHAGFGTVNGPDGKPFKTRDGGVMKLQDLIEMVVNKARERMQEGDIAQEYPVEEQHEIAEKIGLAALKFADLSNNRISNYTFDLDRFSAFEGKTGPYLVYTAVRIKSIFRKLDLGDAVFSLQSPTDIERPLMLALTRLPEAIQGAYENNLPHLLADQAYLLAQEYSRFYQQTNIVREEDTAKRESWIALSQAALKQLTLLLDLLGIEVPERM